jgi:integrase
MATIKYILKTKNELSQIYIRLIDGRKTDLTVSTGYFINPEFWTVLEKDKKGSGLGTGKGQIKQTSKNQEKQNLTNKLNGLQRKVEDCLNNDKGSGIEINKEWLESVIEKYKNPLLELKNDSFVQIVRDYQSEMKIKINPKSGKRIAPTTIRNFNTTIMRLEKFEVYKKKKLLISDIDLTFHSEFVKYERNVLTLSQNSISKDIKQIKTVCIDARDRGYSINEQVLSRKFNAPTESTLFVTITEDEIKRIKSFKGADYLQNARDWLIVGCWTGCRVADLMKLTNNNILITPKGQKFIRYTQSKTNKQVDIPIHSDVQEILERLGGFPRPISDQRFNEWIKEVCKHKTVKINDLVHGTRQNPDTHLKEVGTFEKWQLIRSHTCRRSFATNHYNKLPNKLIMAVTGHATERMLLNYIGETENEHIDDFLSVWASDKQEQKKVIEMNKKVK